MPTLPSIWNYQQNLIPILSSADMKGHITEKDNSPSANIQNCKRKISDDPDVERYLNNNVNNGQNLVKRILKDLKSKI
jgi:hypothetical protein